MAGAARAAHSRILIYDEHHDPHQKRVRHVETVMHSPVRSSIMKWREQVV
jgi:hypothetical protein